MGMVPVENIAAGMGSEKNGEVGMGFVGDEVVVEGEDAVHNHNRSHAEVAEDTPHMDNNVPQDALLA